MKKGLFLAGAVFLLFLSVSMTGQAAKNYFIIVNGQKYAITKESYDLLLNDGDAAAYVFGVHNIPLPKDGQYILRMEDDGKPENPNSETSTPAPTSSPKPVTPAKKKIILLKGDVTKPKLNNYKKTVSWKSKNSRIITKMSDGRVKAKNTGSTKIYVKINGKKIYCSIAVKARTETNRINLALKEIMNKGMSKREKVKSVHNWLIANVKYDYKNYLKGKVPAVSHTSKGALLKGIAVCDGYSYAFKKFMKKIKVPCQMVYGYAQGGAHAWNKVKLDGKWKYVDVTFDDPIINGKNNNKKPFYNFFLKTRAQMNATHYITNQ